MTDLPIRGREEGAQSRSTKNFELAQFPSSSMERYFCLRSPRNFLDPREFIIRKGRFLLSLSNLFGKFLPLRDGDLLEGDRVGIFWGKFLPEGRGKSKREMDGRRGIFAGVALVIGSWELIGLVGAANGRPGTPAGIS